ncbi:unnamed protein product [Closterium sp. NIES-65]|nr:unnamed protein product [Closterium sp. NIES-65]
MLKKKRGKEGNAAKYTTRNQALVRLQLKLADFRRLCILKGIHPREPKKKTKGAHKTYYHVKDINFLAHEPLLELQREMRAQRKKIRKAKGRLETDKVERLERSMPRVSLDHLVKERYPSFMDATRDLDDVLTMLHLFATLPLPFPSRSLSGLSHAPPPLMHPRRYPSFIDAIRDLDDALTMLHLFATLPADATFRIPATRVNNARRLSLEWQAYITRTHALRKVFVSVKGIYYQAQVVGQPVTWLVPHQLMQVMPTDVDFRVMLTFLEFYETLMGFVNFKLYHELRLAYPPRLDPRLEKAAADLYAVMRKLAEAAAAGHTALHLHVLYLYAVMRKLAEAAAAARQKRERKAFKEAAAASAALLGAAPTAAAAGAGDDAALQKRAEKSADGGGEEGKAEGEADGAAAASTAAEPAAGEGEGAAAAEPAVDAEKEASEKLPLLRKQATASRMASLQSRLAAMAAAAEANPDEEEKAEGGAGRKGAGRAEAEEEEEEEEGDEDDEETRACGRLFRGLVFFLGREVPREPLLFVIRAFGGKASWEGEGAPAPETDEAITHQVVDRPQQKHRNLSRDYVQPQWVFDCANARILLPSAPYAPGLVPPPHLSPFVNHEEEGYLPDYAAAIQRLKEAAAARDAAQHKGAAGGMLGMGAGGSLMELEGAHEVRMSGEGSVAVGGGEDEVKAEEAALAAKIAEVAAEEKAYAADLAKELSGVPFSSSLVQGKGIKDREEDDEGDNTAEGEEEEEGEGGEADEEEDEDEEGEGEEEEERQGGAAAVPAAGEENEEDGGKAAARMLMSRKRRGLYDAMQMGRAKKAAGVALLHERRLKAAAAAAGGGAAAKGAGGAGGGAKGAGGGAKGAGEGGKKGGQQGKKAKQEKKGWR